MIKFKSLAQPLAQHLTVLLYQHLSKRSTQSLAMQFTYQLAPKLRYKVSIISCTSRTKLLVHFRFLLFPLILNCETEQQQLQNDWALFHFQEWLPLDRTNKDKVVYFTFNSSNNICNNRNIRNNNRKTTTRHKKAF